MIDPDIVGLGLTALALYGALSFWPIVRYKDRPPVLTMVTVRLVTVGAALAYWAVR